MTDLQASSSIIKELEDVRRTMGKNGLRKIEKAYKKGKLAGDVVAAFKLGATTARTNNVAVVENEEETSSPTRADDVCDGRMTSHIRSDRPDDGICLPTRDDDEKLEIPTTSTTIIGEVEEVVVEPTSPNIIMDRRNKSNAADGHEIPAPHQKSPTPVVAAPAKFVYVAPDDNNNNMLVVGSIIWTVLAAYHVWTCMESIRSSQFPASVVSIFVGGAFLYGYNMGKRSLFLVEKEEGGVDDEPGLLLLRERPVGEDEPAVEVGERRKWWKPPPTPKNRLRKRNKFKTILSHSPISKRELKEWEIKLRAPFTDGPLMDHLLKISPDFGRKTKTLKKSQCKSVVGDDDDAAAAAAARDGDETDERVIDHAPIGKVELNDTRANALESHEDFSHVVDPMCKLRGMDLFLTDDPQEGIWRQPLLNQ